MPVLSTDTRTYSPPTLYQTSVARVLLADDDLTSRLTLKTILAAAGYAVDGAASASEAINRLEENEYQLVLADLQAGGGDASHRLLAYARQKAYRPATARISSRISEEDPGFGGEDESVVSIADEMLSELLEKVATLISHRANRRILRATRAA